MKRPSDMYYNSRDFESGCAMNPLRNGTEDLIVCRICGQHVVRSHGTMMQHMIAHLDLKTADHDGVYEAIILGDAHRKCLVCGEDILAIAQEGCSCCGVERNIGYWWMLHLMLNPEHYPILLLMGDAGNV